MTCSMFSRDGKSDAGVNAAGGVTFGKDAGVDAACFTAVGKVGPFLAGVSGYSGVSLKRRQNCL